MSSEAKNLEAITNAIAQHNKTCPYKLLEVRMNPFEVERLDWPTVSGVPIVADENIGTGRFELVCNKGKQIEEEIEDTAIESELVSV
jgi:hypothetical protein